MTNELHLIRPGEGEVADLGVIKMRILAAGDATNREFTLAEFVGGPGPWTVLHTHHQTIESYYVSAGSFTFVIGDGEVSVERGDYLMTPRGTPHMMTGGPDGGTLLTLMVPGGLEDMFFELSRLGPESITNPAVRAEVASKYDSVPVR
jgi:mannose-6-phosphate isomerase-like protein (cupin superfamily)